VPTTTHTSKFHALQVDTAGGELIRKVFAGCCQPLLRKGLSQRYLCRPSLRAGTHTPAAPKVPSPVPSPGTLAFPASTPGRRLASLHHCYFGWSVFWSCSHFFTFRPTGLLASQVAPTLTLACRAAETFTAAHITVGYLPRAAAMLTIQYRAIDGKGTCTPQIRQTCWLLRTWRRSTARPQKPSLSSSPWMRGAPQRGLSMLIRRINTRSSVSICGRPPEDRDFQRQ
jgi:hypothetical protein